MLDICSKRKANIKIIMRFHQKAIVWAACFRQNFWICRRGGNSYRMQPLEQQSDWYTPQYSFFRKNVRGHKASLTRSSPGQFLFYRRVRTVTRLIARPIFILPMCQSRHTSHCAKAGIYPALLVYAKAAALSTGKNNQNWPALSLPSIFARKAAVYSGHKIIRKIKCFIYKRAKLC